MVLMGKFRYNYLIPLTLEGFLNSKQNGGEIYGEKYSLIYFRRHDRDLLIRPQARNYAGYAP